MRTIPHQLQIIEFQKHTKLQNLKAINIEIYTMFRKFTPRRSEQTYNQNKGDYLI